MRIIASSCESETSNHIFNTCVRGVCSFIVSNPQISLFFHHSDDVEEYCPTLDCQFHSPKRPVQRFQCRSFCAINCTLPHDALFLATSPTKISLSAANHLDLSTLTKTSHLHLHLFTCLCACAFRGFLLTCFLLARPTRIALSFVTIRTSQLSPLSLFH